VAREIRKKVIDQDIQPSSSEDFDEKMLEQIEKEFDQVTLDGGTLKSTVDTTSFDFAEHTATKTKFSLDDFETFVDQGQDLFEEKPSQQAEPETPAGRTRGKPQARIARNKIIMMSLGGLLLLSIAGFLLAHLMREPSPEEPRVTRMIKHQIVIQYYQEQFDLLILANAQREKDLISLGIEFKFPSQEAFEDFLKENIVFRDVIYQFLQGERPVKNSQKYWQQVVENGLLNYLKAIFPKNGLSSIRMVYLDRL